METRQALILREYCWLSPSEGVKEVNPCCPLHRRYAMSEAVFVSPVSPSSYMGEAVKTWSSRGDTNCTGEATSVKIMKEADASGIITAPVEAGAEVFSITWVCLC